MLRSKKPGKTLMIRSDIDALPVQEETGLPFKSTHDGAMHAEYELNYSQGYPPTINNDFMSDVVKGCAEETVGQKKVIEPEPTMGGEDMAFFLEKSKGCYFFLGVGREGSVSLYNPNFDFNEDVLLKGVETYIRCALKLLG